MTPLPAGGTKSLIRGCGRVQRSSSLPAILTRRYDCPGNSAVIGLRAVRPEVLRPRLSAGLPLDTPGVSGVTFAQCRRRASRSNLLIVLKVNSLAENVVGEPEAAACLPLPTTIALLSAGKDQSLCFIS